MPKTLSHQQEETWRCNFCGQTEGVTNGICPNCGPAQTTPLNDEAKRIAGAEVVVEGTFDNDNGDNE